VVGVAGWRRRRSRLPHAISFLPLRLVSADREAISIFLIFDHVVIVGGGLYVRSSKQCN
jgi:hypothetical protein